MWDCYWSWEQANGNPPEWVVVIHGACPPGQDCHKPTAPGDYLGQVRGTNCEVSA